MCPKFQMSSIQYGEFVYEKKTTKKALESCIGEILDTLQKHEDK